MSGLKSPKPSTERVVFLVGRAAERLQLPLHSRRRFGTPRSATPPLCPQRRPPSCHSQACARALTNPLKGSCLLDRGQGLKEPVHQVPSPETVVTGGGSDVLETGRSREDHKSPTLTAVSRHGFLAYVELDLLKLAFERSGLLHLMYIYFSAVHCFFPLILFLDFLRTLDCGARSCISQSTLLSFRRARYIRSRLQEGKNRKRSSRWQRKWPPLPLAPLRQLQTTESRPTRKDQRLFR